NPPFLGLISSVILSVVGACSPIYGQAYRQSTQTQVPPSRDLPHDERAPLDLEAFRVRGFGVTPGAQSSHYPPRSSVPPQVAGDHDIDCAAPPSLSIRTLLRREPSHFGPMKSLPLTLLLWARGELSVLSPRLGDRVVRVADLRTATIRPSLLPLPRLPFPWLPFPSQRPNVFLV